MCAIYLHFIYIVWTYIVFHLYCAMCTLHFTNCVAWKDFLSQFSMYAIVVLYWFFLLFHKKCCWVVFSALRVYHAVRSHYQWRSYTFRRTSEYRIYECYRRSNSLWDFVHISFKTIIILKLTNEKTIAEGEIFLSFSIYRKFINIV